MTSNLILSAGGRRYGRTPPAPMPWQRQLKRAMPANYPLYGDLANFDGPPKDQGEEGSCTGHAFAESGEWIVRRWMPTLGPLVFSPQYPYALALMAQGDFPNDDGSDGVTLANVVIQNGFCPLDAFPYVPGQITQPTAAQLAAGAANRFVGAYHSVADGETAVSILADPVPWVIQVGFTVYSSFESGEVATTGVYNPQPGEQVLGGHEVKASGWDIGATPTLRPVGCPPAVKIQNSWGSGWGLKGYFWMPLTVLDASDTDIKIIHLGSPWK